MIVAGIDPSLTRTAVCVGNAEGHQVKCFESKLETQYQGGGDYVRNRMRRLDILVHKICQFIEHYKPTVVFIEAYSFGNNDARASYSHEFGGVLRWHFTDYDFVKQIREVAPTTLKKFAIGVGRGEKNLIGAHITKRYGVLLNNNDEYDAFTLFAMALVASGQMDPSTQAQREAVDTAMGIKTKSKRTPNQGVLPMEGGKPKLFSPNEPAPF